MAWTRRRLKKAPIRRLMVTKRTRKVWPNLVGGLRNAGPDHGDKRGAGRAKPLHRPDGFLQHPVKRPTPASMGRTDHPSDGIVQQHRRTVSSEHAERDTTSARDQCIGLDATFGGHVLNRKDARTMDLMAGAQNTETQSCGRAAPILEHTRRGVARARPTVKRLVEAVRDTALAREKAVCDAIAR